MVDEERDTAEEEESVKPRCPRIDNQCAFLPQLKRFGLLLPKAEKKLPHPPFGQREAPLMQVRYAQPVREQVVPVKPHEGA